VLQTDVELKFRMAGIRILTEDEMFLTQGSPYLYVNVNVIEFKSISGFVFSTRVELIQNVILSRNRSIKTAATTWEENLTGFYPNLGPIRESVSELVNSFMNDYLTVNPK